MYSAYVNGNKVISDDGRTWRYLDGEPHKPGEVTRICPNCGKMPSDGLDACLGRLPGVVNACCGHGLAGEGYIQFENGTIIRGTFTSIEKGE